MIWRGRSFVDSRGRKGSDGRLDRNAAEGFAMRDKIGNCPTYAMAVKTNATCQLPPPPIDNHPLCLSANNAATANGADTPMESNHQQQSQLRNDMTTSNTGRRMNAANDTANVTHGRDTDERQESRSERSSGRADDDRASPPRPGREKGTEEGSSSSARHHRLKV